MWDATLSKNMVVLCNKIASEVYDQSNLSCTEFCTELDHVTYKSLKQ
jgi:hypothetical protein